MNRYTLRKQHPLQELNQEERDDRRNIDSTSKWRYDPPDRTDDRLRQIDDHPTDRIAGKGVDKRKHAPSQDRQRQYLQQNPDQIVTAIHAPRSIACLVETDSQYS